LVTGASNAATPEKLKSAPKQKTHLPVQSLAVGQNEVPACKLLYPSHFLTPEDADAQHIAAQQQIFAAIRLGAFT
jgi:hypothetical protein